MSWPQRQRAGVTLAASAAAVLSRGAGAVGPGRGGAGVVEAHLVR